MERVECLPNTFDGQRVAILRHVEGNCRDTVLHVEFNALVCHGPTLKGKGIRDKGKRLRPERGAKFRLRRGYGASSPELEERRRAPSESEQAFSVEYERKAHVVELRFFGGLSVEETAEVVGISEETVMRDWKFAKKLAVARAVAQSEKGKGIREKGQGERISALTEFQPLALVWV
jgi:hypothetical protein